MKACTQEAFMTLLQGLTEENRGTYFSKYALVGLSPGIFLIPPLRRGFGFKKAD